MEEFIKQNDKNKLKGLAYYQIAGGVFGMFMVIWSMANTLPFSLAVVIFLLIIIGLYSFSIFCGQQIIVGHFKRGLKLSKINQALQFIHFSILGFAFKFVSGLMFTIGIDYSKNLNLTTDFVFSTFQLNINQEKELLTIGVNLIAIYLFYYLDKLENKIELDRELFESSQQEVLKNSRE